ncbi:hypothetical protein MSAN_01726300 [Mycena sanguinolenta]|uniref:Uncharacterized protein n=1 Tax=Mycena sanguinolenta TaxID=230812 RepID=A0A8H6XW80_9AGAR|nr:hypothetical protein MSAN_01726300 [Mycena sanguinolenta]
MPNKSHPGPLLPHPSSSDTPTSPRPISTRRIYLHTHLLSPSCLPRPRPQTIRPRDRLSLQYHFSQSRRSPSPRSLPSTLLATICFPTLHPLATGLAVWTRFASADSPFRLSHLSFLRLGPARSRPQPPLNSMHRSTFGLDGSWTRSAFPSLSPLGSLPLPSTRLAYRFAHLAARPPATHLHTRIFFSHPPSPSPLSLSPFSLLITLFDLDALLSISRCSTFRASTWPAVDCIVSSLSSDRGPAQKARRDGWFLDGTGLDLDRLDLMGPRLDSPLDLDSDSSPPLPHPPPASSWLSSFATRPVFPPWKESFFCSHSAPPGARLGFLVVATLSQGCKVSVRVAFAIAIHTAFSALLCAGTRGSKSVDTQDSFKSNRSRQSVLQQAPSHPWACVYVLGSSLFAPRES